MRAKVPKPDTSSEAHSALWGGNHCNEIAGPGENPEESRQFALLPEKFYLPAPDIVARKLLGKLLIRRIESQTLIGRIVEAEAYFGDDDPAAHSFAGRTARNAVVFGPPGRAYVYFVYGMHYCLNVSCEPEGRAGCILLRALEPLAGRALMAKLRKLAEDASSRLLTSGPGRLCQAMSITRSAFNGMDLTSSSSELQIGDDGFVPPLIVVSRRIGIRKASHFPLRFFLESNRFVSASRENVTTEST